MKKQFGAFIAISIAAVFISGCSGDYHTFADYPGFAEYYMERCIHSPPPSSRRDLELLEKYRPRFVLPPGGSYPIDFYRDYVPYTVLKSWPERNVITEIVTKDLLQKHRTDRGAYLNFDIERFRSDGKDLKRQINSPKPGPDRKPVIYGRVYRERVRFPDEKGGTEDHELTFLKYNVLFATSGLAARLPAWPRFFLALSGFDKEDWHVLDNFVAAHIVLDEKDLPIAAVLAQHNHHRTYLLGMDILKPPDGRMIFDIALRSNEIYPASDTTGPVSHRVIRSTLDLDYLLSGENAPFLKGEDLTWGINAGGIEFEYDLKVISPCDPLYTSEMLLGQPRPFMGLYIGRDGPPGSDYFNLPELLPMGNMLKFSYLKEDDPEDIAVIRRAIDRKRKKVDHERIMEHGGKKFLEDWMEIRKR